MGTSFAVEIAQHAHAVLLQRSGGLCKHEQVAYRHPLPRGPGFDMLCIDDRVYLLLVNASEAGHQPNINRRDAVLFQRAAARYKQTGLRTSDSKAIRNAYQAVVLGRELDGIRGDLEAPHLRTVTLCILTFQFIVLGCCTKNRVFWAVGFLFACSDAR